MRHHIGGGAGVTGRDLDLGRRDVRVLRNRQRHHSHQTGDGDDDGNDRRKNGAIDEEFGEHGVVEMLGGEINAGRMKCATLAYRGLLKAFD